MHLVVKKLTNRMYNSGHNSKKCLNQLASLYQQSLNKNRIFENINLLMTILIMASISIHWLGEHMHQK